MKYIKTLDYFKKVLEIFFVHSITGKTLWTTFVAHSSFFFPKPPYLIVSVVLSSVIYYDTVDGPSYEKTTVIKP